MEERTERDEIASFDTGEQGCEPKNVGIPQKLEKVRKQTPRSYRKDYIPASSLIVAQEDLYWTSSLPQLEVNFCVVIKLG